MDITAELTWPTTIDAALDAQRRLRPLVDPADRLPEPLRTVAGVDVAYSSHSDRVSAAVVVLDADTLDVLDTATAVGSVSFPYAPGLFAFRELPSITEALRRLRTVPDLVVCDGHGLAHPRRFGLACHLGVLLDLPTIGVAKTAFVGHYDTPAPERGAWSPLLLDAETVGCVLRTRTGVKPVFVSPGHRVSLETARALTLTLSPRFRLPETTRHADRLSRAALAAADQARSSE